ncbi:MAG: alpha/beta hydrolase [Epsilonproteobacteria bacterium]|nr:alpha/beta hydrolase [Campylobacterota bacterium]
MIYIIYLSIVFILLLFVYFEWQKSVVFHPKFYRDMSLYDNQYTFLTLKSGNITLEGCMYEPEGPKGTILYFGGRGQDSVGLLPKLVETLPNLRIVTFNYRGYGKSQGNPNEKALLQDGVLVAQKIQKRYQNVTVIGYSLGGSIASYVALHVKVSSLVLIGAFCSLDSLIYQKYKRKLPLLRYHFFTCKYLKDVKIPVALLISKDDDVIDYNESKKIKEFIQKLYIYKELDKLNHRELLLNKEVISVINEIVQNS